MLIALAAVVVALWLGASASPKARLVLAASALLMAAALFLPLTLLHGWMPLRLMNGLENLAHALHSDVAQLAHLIIFGWLAFALWLLRPDLRGWRAVAVLLVLAVSSELVQAMTIERHPALKDVGVNLLAEAVGVGLAIAAVALARLRRERA